MRMSVLDTCRVSHMYMIMWYIVELLMWWHVLLVSFFFYTQMSNWIVVHFWVHFRNCYCSVNCLAWKARLH